MGKTIVISEHRLYFLMDLVDKAVYIEHGVIQKVYTGDEFRALADSERIRLGLRCFTLDNEKMRCLQSVIQAYWRLIIYP